MLPRLKPMPVIIVIFRISCDLSLSLLFCVCVWSGHFVFYGCPSVTRENFEKLYMYIDEKLLLLMVKMIKKKKIKKKIIQGLLICKGRSYLINFAFLMGNSFFFCKGRWFLRSWKQIKSGITFTEVKISNFILSRPMLSFSYYV